MRLPILIAVFLVPCQLLAQDVAFDAALEDSVVVTAFRHSSDIRETARRVSVVTAQDLAMLPAASIDEVIRFLGGVETQSRGGFGVQSDVTMRGSSFDGVMILLDGVRIHDPQTGHFLSNFPVPMSEIARVEVIRGPASSIYGPDAVGGVIHFFTWTGLTETEALPSAQASVQVGRHALYDSDVAVRTRAGGVSISGATAWQGSDGQPIFDSSGRAIRSSEGEVRTDFRRQSHTLAAGGAIGRTVVMARMGYDQRDFGSWHFYTPFASDTARSDSRTAWAQVRLRSADRSAPTTIAVHANARIQESSYQYNPISTPNSHTNHVAGVQADVTHRMDPASTIGGGVSFGIRGIDSNSMGTHGDRFAGAYVTARAMPVEGLAVSASSRLDYDPGFGTELTPQAGLAYSRGMITLRTNVGRAVRAATYTERYYDTERANPSGNLGNPDLSAERAWSYEIGGDLWLDGISLHSTIFRRDARDLIDYVRSNIGQPVFLAENIASVRTRGVELDAEASTTISAARLRLAASYSFLNSELDVPAGLEYKYALTHARHIVQGNLSVQIGSLGAGLRTMYREPITGDQSLVVDVRTSYRLRDGISVTGEVRNLLDSEYSEIFDAPMPRRWWIFGLRFG
jgi:vitamin B12 transporter